MKYHIYAKILGTFLPAKALTINGCRIAKGHFSEHVPYDRPTIPVQDVNIMRHSISQGVTSFIQYAQKPISVRTFESEYTISTEIDSHDIRRAEQEARIRFEEVVATLSFAVKTTTRTMGSRRIRRDDDCYDFEIVSAYIKQKNNYTRVKLPEPLINTHNFFPSTPPKGFMSKTKKILSCRDPIFWKALSYIHKANKLRDTGNFDELLVTLNFVKCIELISEAVITAKKNSTGNKLFMRERIHLAGKKIGVTKKNIKNAQEAWDVRNKADIAHAKTHRTGRFSIFFNNQVSSNEFLFKYYKYVNANPPAFYMGTGRDWRYLN